MGTNYCALRIAELRGESAYGSGSAGTGRDQRSGCRLRAEREGAER